MQLYFRIHAVRDLHARQGSNPSLTLEFRSDNFPVAPASFFVLWQMNGGITLDIEPSGILEAVDNLDTAQLTTVSLAGHSDFRTRVIRDYTAQTFCYAVWDGQGNLLGQASVRFASSTPIGTGLTAIWGGVFSGASGRAGNVPFARSYLSGSCASVATAPPAEAPTTAGNNGDFRFEGSGSTILSDSGSAGLALALNTGSATNAARSLSE